MHAPDDTKLVVKNEIDTCGRLEFVLPKPVAPDFFIGHGLIGGMWEVHLDNLAKWDPLDIGVENALALIGRIRREVPGTTEETYVKGYELTVGIAESHFCRVDKIIGEITAIIADFQ